MMMMVVVVITRPICFIIVFSDNDHVHGVKDYDNDVDCCYQ